MKCKNSFFDREKLIWTPLEIFHRWFFFLSIYSSLYSLNSFSFYLFFLAKASRQSLRSGGTISCSSIAFCFTRRSKADTSSTKCSKPGSCRYLFSSFFSAIIILYWTETLQSEIIASPQKFKKIHKFCRTYKVPILQFFIIFYSIIFVIIFFIKNIKKRDGKSLKKKTISAFVCFSLGISLLISYFSFLIKFLRLFISYFRRILFRWITRRMSTLTAASTTTWRTATPSTSAQDRPISGIGSIPSLQENGSILFTWIKWKMFKLQKDKLNENLF